MMEGAQADMAIAGAAQRNHTAHNIDNVYSLFDQSGYGHLGRLLT